MIHQNKSVIISLVNGLFILSNEVKLTLGCSQPLSNDFLAGLTMGQDAVSLFTPSVYYSDEKTKFITTDENSQTIWDSWLCADGASSNNNGIQLYDDGTHGDDFANDGVYTRDCVHICSDKVNFNDIFGFAMLKETHGTQIIVLDVSTRGTVPYDEIQAPLTPGAKTITSSHAFFFADIERNYFPNYPWNLSPNMVSSPEGKSIAVAALLQVFGDVFDFVTVTPLGGQKPALAGWGIHKWQNWDRRGGPMLDQPIGDIDVCSIALSGVPAYRLSGVITSEEVVSGEGIKGELHELVHGVSGYSYHHNLHSAREGDNMHVPGSCTVDHSSLQGPVWDWVHGYPESIPGSGGGVRIEPNNDCNNCNGDLTTCCSFHYADIPSTKAEMLANPELSTMSTLMLYIAGILRKKDISNEEAYYCIGSDTDGGCGSHDGQQACVNTVDDSDRSRVTSNFVSRFTFEDLVDANGGPRFPEKKYNVIRHAAVLISSREPSEAEITFYTLLWQKHEIETEPWERIDDNYPIDNWQFHTRGNSILHSKLHGIDCGEDSHSSIPSCNSGNNNECVGAPCGPGAICKLLDGQPLCLCKEGLVGDGIECAYPSETAYGSMPTGHELLTQGMSHCFPENLWPNFIDESDIPPYPGGMEPYASTSCFGKGVCPVGWRCNKNKGCRPPLSKQICGVNDLDKGQCDALGCCKFTNNKCKKKNSNICEPSVDITTAEHQCENRDTCCYFSCQALQYNHDGEEIGQKGNCGQFCTAGVAPDINGEKHWELYLWKDGYWAEHNFYSYEDENGLLNISGDDKNMFNRCEKQCFQGDAESKFLLGIKRNGSLKRKTCSWLKTRIAQKIETICTKRNLSTQGYKPAKDVCMETCGPYN